MREMHKRVLFSSLTPLSLALLGAVLCSVLSPAEHSASHYNSNRWCFNHNSNNNRWCFNNNNNYVIIDCCIPR